MNTPDKWIVVKINSTENLFKVFATWYGGYLGSDSWKLNSGIVRIEQEDDYFKFYGNSGSCYKCHKDSYGTNLYTQGILNSFIDKVTVLPENTDWLKLL